MSYAIRWKDDGFVGPHAGTLVSEPPHYPSEGEAETVRIGMPNAEHLELVVIADESGKDWVPDRAVTLAALAVIDAAQADLPVCTVCSQRCTRLDKYGTCSKVSERSEPHRLHRERARMAARS